MASRLSGRPHPDFIYTCHEQQEKAHKEIQHKDFWTPPPDIFCVWACLAFSKGKRDPTRKNSGVRGLKGGSGWAMSAEILSALCLVWGPNFELASEKGVF